MGETLRRQGLGGRAVLRLSSSLSPGLAQDASHPELSPHWRASKSSLLPWLQLSAPCWLALFCCLEGKKIFKLQLQEGVGKTIPVPVAKPGTILAYFRKSKDKKFSQALQGTKMKSTQTRAIKTTQKPRAHIKKVAV